MVPEFFIMAKLNVYCYNAKLLTFSLFPVDLERRVIISHFRSSLPI